MGKAVMGGVVSVDVSIAEDNDDVWPLFDCTATATSTGPSRAEPNATSRASSLTPIGGGGYSRLNGSRSSSDESTNCSDAIAR